MMRNLRCLVPILILSVIGTAQSDASKKTAKEELYRVDAAEIIIKAARALMESDENLALVTIDRTGQPRIRSVKAFLNPFDPKDSRRSMTVWVMTRESTRKVDQIRNNAHVTLYFNDDATLSYLSIMGTANVHTDPENPKVKAFLQLEGYKEFFWPQFPKGFIMIEVVPSWLEFMGPGIKNHKENWRPQAVEFAAK